MPDTKVENETSLTSFNGDEVFYVVDDPSGTPAARKVSFDDLAAHFAIPHLPGQGFQAPPWHMAWGSFAVSNDSISWNPFFVSYRTTVTKIGLVCGTAVANSKARVGIWSLRQPGMMIPGTMLIDAGEIATDTVGALFSSTFSLNLRAGWYLAGIVTTGSANIYRATGGITGAFGGGIFTTGYGAAHGCNRAQAFGAFADESLAVTSYQGNQANPFLIVY